jgi:hypothetical protein
MGPYSTNARLKRHPPFTEIASSSIHPDKVGYLFFHRSLKHTFEYNSTFSCHYKIPLFLSLSLPTTHLGSWFKTTTILAPNAPFPLHPNTHVQVYLSLTKRYQEESILGTLIFLQFQHQHRFARFN